MTNQQNNQKIFDLVALHKNGDKETFKKIDEILKTGLNIDECVGGGSIKKPILLYAISCVKKDIVEYLLDNGADPFKSDKFGCNMLHSIALNTNSKEYFDLFKHVVEELDKSKNILNKRDNIGVSVLHIFFEKSMGSFEEISYCLNKGMDINCVDNNGNTPLHYLAGSLIYNYSLCPKDILFLKHVLTKGADMHLKNNEGKSFLNIIMDSEHSVIIDPILDLMERIKNRKLEELNKKILEEIKINNTYKTRLKSKNKNKKIGGFKNA